ncbi:MAG: hypothetical protein AAGF11_15585 [Myxococcota bacterium]
MPCASPLAIITDNMASAGVRTSWILLATLATGCSGMVVMVNGEPRRIGGKRGGTRIQGAELPADFSPNPRTIEIPLARTQFDQLGLSAHGLGQCGTSGETTPRPATTFHLDRPHEDLELRHHGSQIVSRGALIRPDGKIECLDGKHLVDLGTWPEGTYTYHPISDYPNQDPGQAKLVLTAPRRAQREARARLVDEVHPEPTLNPTYARVQPGPGPAIQATHLGMESCIDGRASSAVLTPIARLVVKQPSTFAIEVRGAKRSDIYVRLADDPCQPGNASDRDPARGGLSLPAGTHEIWLKTSATPSLPDSWDVAVLDTESFYALGEAPVHPITGPDAPITVLSTTSAEPPPRGLLCGRGSRDPNFYVRVGEPSEELGIQALFSEARPLPGQARAGEALAPTSTSSTLAFVERANHPNVAGFAAEAAGDHQGVRARGERQRGARHASDPS